MLRRFQGIFNNLPVRNKLFLIVIFGTFLPLFLANSFFISNILHDVRESEQEFIRASVDSLVRDLESEFISILSVSRLIYADGGIYSNLDRDMSDPGEFYSLHHDFLNPTLQKYISVYDNVVKITIYAENASLRTSAGYLSLNDYNRSTLWYERLESKGGVPFILYHEDFDRRQSYISSSFLSLFRVMDNKALRKSTSPIIQRIDIELGEFQKYLDRLEFSGVLRLTDPWGAVVLEEKRGGAGENPFTFDLPVSAHEEIGDWTLAGEIRMSGYDLGSAFKLRNFVIISVASLILSSLFIFALSYSFSHRLQILSHHMQKVENQDFTPISGVAAGNDEIGWLFRDFNIMADRIDKLINEVYRGELEREKLRSSRRKTQLNALQSQINPHFLNNVLEAIRMKSLIKDERETADIVKKLGRLFRRITYWKDDMVTVQDELDFVREYLEIQSYRFDDRLAWSVKCPDVLMKTAIPKVTIQGLVENACIHGIERKGAPGRIDVAVSRENNRVRICVSDDGVGMETGEKEWEGNHSGLANIEQRLKMHYGDDVSLIIQSELNVGTNIIIALPPEEKNLG